MGSPDIKCDAMKEFKMWRHKGRQLWWKSWRLYSCIGRSCNTCTDLTSMICLTDSSKLGEELCFKEGGSFGVLQCSIASII